MRFHVAAHPLLKDRRVPVQLGLALGAVGVLGPGPGGQRLPGRGQAGVLDRRGAEGYHGIAGFMQLGPGLPFLSGQGFAAFVRRGQPRSPLCRVLARLAEPLVRLSDRLQRLGDIGFARGIGQGGRDLVQLQPGSLGGPARHRGGGNRLSVRSPCRAGLRLGCVRCCPGGVSGRREPGDGESDDRLEAHRAVVADVQILGEGNGGMRPLGARQGIPGPLMIPLGRE